MGPAAFPAYLMEDTHTQRGAGEEITKRSKFPLCRFQGESLPSLAVIPLGLGIFYFKLGGRQFLKGKEFPSCAHGQSRNHEEESLLNPRR